MFRPTIITIVAGMLMHLGVFAESPYESNKSSRLSPGSDFVEMKLKEQESKKWTQHKEAFSRGKRRSRRSQNTEIDRALTRKKDNLFKVGESAEYKVLKEDSVVEIRNPRSGKRIVTVIRASVLPDEELNRYDLEYTLMELDRLSIQVEKHDEKPREVRVEWDGTIAYPLIGESSVKGKTVSRIEKEFVEKFRKYVHDPVVHISVIEKSPLSRILVIGSGFKEYQGHEKILDIIGSDYEPTVENIYDRVCVVRKYPDNSWKVIVVDVEYMFETFDFSQNIPLLAGDVIVVKKMPPLFGLRFKFWWSQVLSWLNEVDQFSNAVRSINNFELNR